MIVIVIANGMIKYFFYLNSFLILPCASVFACATLRVTDVMVPLYLPRPNVHETRCPLWYFLRKSFVGGGGITVAQPSHSYTPFIRSKACSCTK